jgi:TPR repeat protein
MRGGGGVRRQHARIRHAPFCFFELSRIHSEGIIEKKNSALEFLYLKRSAEEGFVSAQHLLGIAYHEGVNCQKNDRKA